MPREEIETVIDSPTAEAYRIVGEGVKSGGLVIDLDSARGKGDPHPVFREAQHPFLRKPPWLSHRGVLLCR